MLFKIIGKPVYILGGFHGLHSSHRPWPESWIDTWRGTYHLVVESRFDHPVLNLGNKYTDGKSLRETLGERSFLKVDLAWKELGLDSLELNQSKPWWAYVQLSVILGMAAGFDTTLGTDTQFLETAKREQGATIDVLEPVGASLDCYRLLAVNEQIKLLEYFCDDLSRARSDFFGMVRAWEYGDVNELSNFVEARSKLFPALFKCLIYNRNNAWTPTLLRVIQGGNRVVITVGALHCVGTGSIIDNLSKHGVETKFISAFYEATPN